MARDIKIFWDNDTQEGDIKMGVSDLERDGGLETAVMLSLYSDRRALDSDDYDNDNKRGWWGDELNIDNDQTGSRLWLLERSKTTQQSLNLAKGYVREALQWMIDDGVCMKIDIVAQRYNRQNPARPEIGDTLAMQIKIRKFDGTETVMKFNDIWEAQFS